MSLRLFSFGIVLAAIYTAYNASTSTSAGSASGSPLSRSSLASAWSSLSHSPSFWHRTFFPYSFLNPYFTEQSHIVQHPPPKDALSPALVKKAREAAARAESRRNAAPVWPVYFISNGGHDGRIGRELLLAGGNADGLDSEAGGRGLSMQYRSWRDIGNEILPPDSAVKRPKGIVIVSSGWEGEHDTVHVNTDLDNNPTYALPKQERRGKTASSEEAESQVDVERYQDSLPFTSTSDPALAERIMHLLRNSKIQAKGTSRGLDPGAWIPLRGLFNASALPEAAVPVVQVSLLGTGSARIALSLGKALRPLRDEGYLLMGTGMLVSNPHDAVREQREGVEGYAESFSKAVRGMLLDYTGSDREIKAQQIVWRPEYRNAHPTPVELFALYFAVGAAGDDEAELLFDMIDGNRAWGNYRFGSVDQVM